MSLTKLDIKTLLHAYCNGYFPMPDPTTEEIRWYHPEPRAVLPLNEMHISRSLKRAIRRGGYEVTFNKSFLGVMQGCADRKDTWINQEFLRAYGELHRLGLAHSVEISHGDALSGGLYGVAIGGAFFAESKFHRVTDASKLALFHLVQQLKADGFHLLEVQFMTPHLRSLGVVEVSGDAYREQLAHALGLSCRFGGIALDARALI